MKADRLNKHLWLRVTLAALFAATISGCGGGGSEADPPAPAPVPAPSGVARVDVSPASIDDFWGYSVQLQVTARDGAGVSISPRPALTLSAADASLVGTDAATATVNLLRPGSTTVNATIGGVVGAATVNVRGFERLARVKLDTMCALADGRQRIYCWGDAGITGSPMITSTPQQFEYVAPTPIPAGDIPTGARISKVVGDLFNMCALSDDGEVFCWGNGGSVGSLGIGSSESRTSPTRLANGERPAGVRYIDVSVDAYGGCAVGDDGKLYCWGNYAINPSPTVPINGLSLAPVVAAQGSVPVTAKLLKVAVGRNRSCTLADDGRAYCWTISNRTLTLIDQGAVPSNVKLVEIQMGDIACALADNGQIYCWGTGQGRQFGDGTTTLVSNRAPTAVADGAKPAGVRFTSFSVGGRSIASCATAEDRQTYCWGNGYRGSLGDNNLSDHEAFTPVRVTDGEKDGAFSFAQVNCAQYACTGLGTDRRIYSWGSNEARMLSRDNQFLHSATPIMVTRPTRP
jgi:Regulator of chromosome condensation (RCC1) repeat